MSIDAKTDPRSPTSPEPPAAPTAEATDVATPEDAAEAVAAAEEDETASDERATDEPSSEEGVVSEGAASEGVVVEQGEPEGEVGQAPVRRRATSAPVMGEVSVTDGVRSRSTYAVSLEVFEGPLDLLLHLVRRHELDILDIPIAFITEKYLEYLEFARALDLEIAGEYLVMAATLAHLKSRELVPSAPTAEEDDSMSDEVEDPREELLRRLLEYERYRQAGLELDARAVSGRDVFPRGGSIDVEALDPGLASLTLFRLAEAYNRILERARVKQAHEVVLERVTVRERMVQLSLLLDEQPTLDFEELFLTREWNSEAELRQMLVVTLMSVLEMVKLGLVSIQQVPGTETIVLRQVGDSVEARRVINAFREEEEDRSSSDETDEIEDGDLGGELDDDLTDLHEVDDFDGLDEGSTDEEPVDDGSIDEGSTSEEPTDDGLVDEGAADVGLTDEGPTDEGPTSEEPIAEEPTDEDPTDEGSTDEEPTSEELTDEGPDNGRDDELLGPFAPAPSDEPVNDEPPTSDRTNVADSESVTDSETSKDHG